MGGQTAQDCAWSYPEPTSGFEPIRDHLAVYPAAMEACYVGDEPVRPQPGGFYGGWITSNLVGPFKGGQAPRAGDSNSKLSHCADVNLTVVQLLP